MNKIQKEFEKKYTAEFLKTCGYKIEFDEYWDNSMIQEEYIIFSRGYESANLFPTEKVCPECKDGKIYTVCNKCQGKGCTDCAMVGEWLEDCMNSNCKNGIIQIYYTPKQYEKIMSKPYPDDAMVYYKMGELPKWTFTSYARYKHIFDDVSDDLAKWGKIVPVVIVQTAQPAPLADYRPDE